MRSMPLPPSDARDTVRRVEPDGPAAGRRAARRLVDLLHTGASAETASAQSDAAGEWFESVLAELDAEASATAAH